MPGKTYELVYEIALDQFGYFTAAQALEAGATRQSLEMMAKRDKVERVSHGVYRVNAIPVTRFDPYMEATLWPGRQRGILSHETVLELNGISDVNPEKIHVTVPKQFRTHRAVPSIYVLHHADLDAREVSSFEGISTTTVMRAIEDCHRTHLGQALLEQAIADGFKRGLLTHIEADKLREDILMSQPPEVA
jgi:predicted transcriptional regulator of viral defense system